MEFLVPIFVAVLNAATSLGPKVIDFFTQVRAHPDLKPDAAKLLDGLEANHQRHVDYLDKREPLKPHGAPAQPPEE